MRSKGLHPFAQFSVHGCTENCALTHFFLTVRDGIMGMVYKIKLLVFGTEALIIREDKGLGGPDSNNPEKCPNLSQLLESWHRT